MEWLDVAGAYLRSGSWLAIAGVSGALTAALQAGSNANLYLTTRGAPIVGTTTPAGSLYPYVQDIAQFVFVTAALTQVALTVPAPVASMFGAGGQTVDPTDALAAAIIAAAIGNLSDINGSPVTGFLSGTKSSRRTEQP